MRCLREERVQIQNYLESQGSLLWKRVIIISFSVRHEYLWHQHSLNISVQPHITVMESEQSFEYFFSPRNFKGRRADQYEKQNNQYRADSCAANAVKKGGEELLIFHQTWFSCDLLHFYSKITQLDSLWSFSF